MQGAQPQIERALARQQALLDKDWAVIRRGVDQCIADPAYDKAKGSFWKQAWVLTAKINDQMKQLKSMTQN